MKCCLLLQKNVAEYGKSNDNSSNNVIFRELHPNKCTFLPLLESLCKVDETVVREQAASSMKLIAANLSDSEMQQVFAPIVLRLASAEWFPGRTSSCFLFSSCYARSNS